MEFSWRSRFQSRRRARLLIIQFANSTKCDLVPGRRYLEQRCLWPQFTGWLVFGISDRFQRGRKPDLLLFNPSTGQTAIWFLDRSTVQADVYGPSVPAGWVLKGAADFDADHAPDYVLFNPRLHQSAIWYLTGATFARGVYGPTIPAGYSLALP